MVRAIAGLLAAIAVGLGVLYGWQWLGQLVFPFPPSLGPTDAARRMALVESMSFAAQAWVVAGYPIGAAAGGLLGNRIADARWPAMFVGCTLAGLFLATVTVAQHPLWMTLTGIGLPLLAGVAVAANVGRRTLVDPEPV